MDVAQIFQAVEEIQFLKKLSLQNNLFFIGETEILEYIHNFFTSHQPANDNCYCDLSNNSLEQIFNYFLNNNTYQAIVVVSIREELSLFMTVKEMGDRLNINVPIVRLFADIFINLMCQRNLLQPSSNQLIKPKLAYAVLTTPRSGSTYFCDLLSSTGVAGYPIEHLRTANQTLALNCDFNYFRLLYNLMRYRTTSNGVFGTKFISHFLFELRQAKPKFGKIFQLIDKYILLVRKDKVSQAVSLVLAQKTNVWHIHKNTSHNNPAFQEYQSFLNSIEIDRQLLVEVRKKYNFIANQEKRLRRILEVRQIEPLEVTYEAVLENAPKQINRVLKFLNLGDRSFELHMMNSDIKKMPSDISQAIVERYKDTFEL